MKWGDREKNPYCCFVETLGPSSQGGSGYAKHVPVGSLQRDCVNGTLLVRAVQAEGGGGGHRSVEEWGGKGEPLGWGDGSAIKMLALKALEAELHSQNDASTKEVETSGSRGCAAS